MGPPKNPLTVVIGATKNGGRLTAFVVQEGSYAKVDLLAKAPVHETEDPSLTGVYTYITRKLNVRFDTPPKIVFVEEAAYLWER